MVPSCFILCYIQQTDGPSKFYDGWPLAGVIYLKNQQFVIHSSRKITYDNGLTDNVNYRVAY